MMVALSSSTQNICRFTGDTCIFGRSAQPPYGLLKVHRRVAGLHARTPRNSRSCQRGETANSPLLLSQPIRTNTNPRPLRVLHLCSPFEVGYYPEGSGRRARKVCPSGSLFKCRCPFSLSTPNSVSILAHYSSNSVSNLHPAQSSNKNES